MSCLYFNIIILLSAEDHLLFVKNVYYIVTPVIFRGLIKVVANDIGSGHFVMCDLLHYTMCHRPILSVAR